MVASYERSTLKAACGFMLCMLGLLTPGGIVAQSTISPAASELSPGHDRRKRPPDRLHGHNWTAA